jgi:hypothetical protein
MIFCGAGLIFAVFTLPPYISYLNKKRSAKQQKATIPELTTVGKTSLHIIGISLIMWGFILSVLFG